MPSGRRICWPKPLGRGEPVACEDLWREHYGQALMFAAQMLCHVGATKRAYEVLLQLALAMAFTGPS